MNAGCVTLDEVLAAAAGRAASLVPEISGYLALAVGDATSRLPLRFEDRMVVLTTEGSVSMSRRGDVVSAPDAARTMRDLLARLLSVSVGTMPGLAGAARSREESDRGVDGVIGEIEAALIPVNRAAARRALARLARETLRAKESGKLDRTRAPKQGGARAAPVPLAAAPVAAAPVAAAPVAAVPIAAAPVAAVPLAAAPIAAAPVAAAPVAATALAAAPLTPAPIAAPRAPPAAESAWLPDPLPDPTASTGVLWMDESPSPSCAAAPVQPAPGTSAPARSGTAADLLTEALLADDELPEVLRGSDSPPAGCAAPRSEPTPTEAGLGSLEVATNDTNEPLAARPVVAMGPPARHDVGAVGVEEDLPDAAASAPFAGEALDDPDAATELEVETAMLDDEPPLAPPPEAHEGPYTYTLPWRMGLDAHDGQPRPVQVTMAEAAAAFAVVTAHTPAGPPVVIAPAMARPAEPRPGEQPSEPPPALVELAEPPPAPEPIPLAVVVAAEAATLVAQAPTVAVEVPTVAVEVPTVAEEVPVPAEPWRTALTPVVGRVAAVAAPPALPAPVRAARAAPAQPSPVVEILRAMKTRRDGDAAQPSAPWTRATLQPAVASRVDELLASFGKSAAAEDASVRATAASLKSFAGLDPTAAPPAVVERRPEPLPAPATRVAPPRREPTTPPAPAGARSSSPVLKIAGTLLMLGLLFAATWQARPDLVTALYARLLPRAAPPPGAPAAPPAPATAAPDDEPAARPDPGVLGARALPGATPRPR